MMDAGTCSPFWPGGCSAAISTPSLQGDPKVAHEYMDPARIQHNPIALRIGEEDGVNRPDEFKLLLDMKDKGLGVPPPRMHGQPPRTPTTM